MTPPSKKLDSDTSIMKTAVSGEIHYGFWNLAAKGVGVFNTFFILTSLSLYQYGAFQLLLATNFLLADITSIGGEVMGNELSKLVGRKEEGRAKRLFLHYNTIRASLGVVLGIGIFFGAPLLVPGYGPEFIVVIQLIAFLFLGSVFSALIQSIFKIRLYFKEDAMRSALKKVLQLGMLLFFFFFGTLGLREVLISLIVASWGTLLFSIPLFVRAYRPWRGLVASKEPLLKKIFISYGHWAIWKGMLGRLISRLQPWLIKIFVSTEAVAIYSVAYSIVGIFKNSLKTKTLRAILPRISSKERMRNIFLYATKYLVLGGIVVAFIGGVLGFAAINIFFEKYIISLPFFYVLLVLVPLVGFLQTIDVYLVVLRRQKFAFFRMVFRNALSAAMLLALLPIIGIWGAVTTEIIVTLGIAIFSYKYISSRLPQYRIRFFSFFQFTRQDRKFLKRAYRLVTRMVFGRIRRLVRI